MRAQHAPCVQQVVEVEDRGRALEVRVIGKDFRRAYRRRVELTSAVAVQRPAPRGSGVGLVRKTRSASSSSCGPRSLPAADSQAIFRCRAVRRSKLSRRLMQRKRGGCARCQIRRRSGGASKESAKKLARISSSSIAAAVPWAAGDPAPDPRGKSPTVSRIGDQAPAKFGGQRTGRRVSEAEAGELAARANDVARIAARELGDGIAGSALAHESLRRANARRPHRRRRPPASASITSAPGSMSASAAYWRMMSWQKPWMVTQSRPSRASRSGGQDCRARGRETVEESKSATARGHPARSNSST